MMKTTTIIMVIFKVRLLALPKNPNPDLRKLSANRNKRIYLLNLHHCAIKIWSNFNNTRTSTFRGIFPFETFIPNKNTISIITLEIKHEKKIKETKKHTIGVLGRDYHFVRLSLNNKSRNSRKWKKKLFSIEEKRFE